MIENEYIAEGFSFQSAADAQLASQENKKIEYLQAHMSTSEPENILAIYQKAITDRIFRTPVGIIYLKRLQSFLIKSEEIDNDKIPAIPIEVAYERVLRAEPSPARQRIKAASAPKKKKSMLLPFSILLNMCLIVAVIAMFAMTLASEQPNIINYRKALTNQYAGWEQELTEREQAVRAREQELGISYDEEIKSE